jgi:uncharacterized protein YggL (DUF469 family)
MSDTRSSWDDVHGEHAVFSPSSASRWTKCPASVGLEELAGEDVSGLPAIQGTVAHACAEAYLLASIDDKEYSFPKEVEEEGVIIAVDDEMKDCVTFYVDYCMSIIRECRAKGGRIGVEQEVSILPPVGPKGAMYGTADCIATESLGTMHVIDFKYGYNPVEAEGNLQCAAYGIGGLALHSTEVPFDIKIHIVQPRIRPRVSTWHVKDTDSFLSQYVPIFRKAMEQAEDANDPPSPEVGAHCVYCRAKIHCGEFMRFVERSNGGLLPDEISELKRIFDMKKVLKRFMDEVENTLKSEISSGNEVEGLKVVESIGNREWSDEKAVIEALKARGLKKAAYIKESLLSPAQLEKIIADKDLISDMTIRKVRGLTLVPSSDKRPNATTTARDDFASE